MPRQLFRFFSTVDKQLPAVANRLVTFSPWPKKGSKLILPISVSRYQNDRDAYDSELDAMLTSTAKALAEEKVQSIDVLITGELCKHLPKQEIEELDSHFLTTHRYLLSKHTGSYRLNEFLEAKIDKNKLEANLKKVTEDSAEGTPWYKCMLKMHHKIKTKSGLEDSLRYQRMEVAITKSMAGLYTHMCYLGFAPDFMTYLYQQYSSESIPLFVRITVDKKQLEIKPFVTKAEASIITRHVTLLLEEVLTNDKFPNKEREKLISNCTNLIRLYGDRLQGSKFFGSAKAPTKLENISLKSDNVPLSLTQP